MNDAPRISTRRRILELLKIDGPADSARLAERLELTPMAVKLQLYDLADEGLVEAREVARPRGRPAKVWSLTSASNALFPDTHSLLVRDVLIGIRGTFGEEALSTVLSHRAGEQLERYQRELSNCPEIAGKVAKLAELRSAEGYMARVEIAEVGFLLVENHCPICEAAHECLKLCMLELDLFRAALGPEVRVERTEHILAGARRCAYSIRPIAADQSRLG